MATLVALGNINIGDATWYLSDATSELDTEAQQQNVTTAYVDGTAFTPGAITITGIAVKPYSTSGAGTFTVALRQAGTVVTGTEVTGNASSISTGAMGWYTMLFAAPVTLLAATAYTVAIKGSSVATANFQTLSGNNWARLLITTTQQAPNGTNDRLIIGASILQQSPTTTAGPKTTYTVTMNSTSGTFTVGAASSTALGPGDAVCISGGSTFAYGIAASSAYYLKVNGNLRICGGGTFNIGTTANPIPAGSTAELVIGFGTAVGDYGVRAEMGSTFNTCGTWQGALYYGLHPMVFARVRGDFNAGATSISTADYPNNAVPTQWRSGDSIVLSSTSRNSGQYEAFTLNANNNSSTLALNGTLANQHTGTILNTTINGVTYTQDRRGIIVNLTRNVKIHGTSAANGGYCYAGTTATVNCRLTEFYWLGGGLADKRGFDFLTSTGSGTLYGCVFRDCSAVNGANGMIIPQVPGSASNVTWSWCICYNVSNPFTIRANAGSTVSMDNCVAIRCNAVTIQSVKVSVTNLFSTDGGGILISESAPVTGTLSGLTAFSGQAIGLQIQNLTGVTTGYLGNLTSWRNNTLGFSLENLGGQGNITDLISWGSGSTTLGVSPSTNVVGQWTVRRAFLDAGYNDTFDTTLSPRGVAFSKSTSGITFEDCAFGAGTTFASGDLDVGNGGVPTSMFIQAAFKNCYFGSSTEIAQQSLMLDGSQVTSNKHDQTALNHKVWKRQGTLSFDSTIYDPIGNPNASMRMTPITAAEKLQSTRFYVPVPSGQAATVNVRVRKSVSGDGAAYNGAQPRLIVERNPASGIKPKVNLLSDNQASVESGLTDIIQYGLNGAGLVRDTNTAYQASASVYQYYNPTTGGYQGIILRTIPGVGAPVSVGTNYTFSAYLRAGINNNPVSNGMTYVIGIEWRKSDLSTISTSTLGVSVTSIWARYSISAAAPALAAYAAPVVFFYNGNNNDWFSADAMQLEVGSIATPYVRPSEGGDLVVKTASAAAGTWETLTYTTNATDGTIPTDDTAIGFYVDCDGTTGWVNVDTVTVG